MRIRDCGSRGAARTAVVDAAHLGVGATANVKVTIDPVQLPKALEAFSKLPGVAYVGAITGRFNVFVSIAATNLTDLRTVVSEGIERFDGVQAVELRLVMRTPKNEHHVIAIPPA